MHRRTPLSRLLLTTLASVAVLAPLTPRPAAAAAAATLSIDGVTLTLTGASVPSGPALSPALTDVAQVGSVTSAAGSLVIEAIPFGSFSAGEGLTATPGDAATVLASLNASRRGAGGSAATAPTAGIFGQALPGIRNSGVLGPNGRRSDISEWTAEAGGRLWIVRLVDPPAGAAISLSVSALALPPSAAATRAPAGHGPPQVTVTTAYGPTLPYPSWWSGGNCNDSRWAGANLLATWGTLQICAPGNGAGFTTWVPPIGTMQGFQCVELSLRWMHLAYGVPAYLANGNTVYANYRGTALTKIPNNQLGSPGPVPQPGDVLSIGTFEPWGHTAVVYRSAVDGGGNGTIATLEENAGASGTGQYAVRGWQVQSSRGVIGWLHSPKVVTGDGSFVRTPDGSVYRLAGGAPLHVSNCVPLGGCDLLSVVPDLAQFGTRPVDGTFLVEAETGSVYRVAGGAPLGIDSWTPFGGAQPTIAVNSWTIAALDHLNARPVEGTFLVTIENGAGFRIAGGAPLQLSSWAPFVSPQTVAVTIATVATLNHLNAVPADGTFITGVDTGRTYRVAGGAPFPVSSWAPLGGPQRSISVNQATIDALNHLSALPANGTLLSGQPSTQAWVIEYGRKRAVASTGGVPVNDDVIVPFPLAPDVYSVDSSAGVRAAWTPDVASPTGLAPGLVRGVAVTHGGGYVLDGYGGLHPFGTATPVTTTAYWPGWDITRGVALAADGHSGYVLDAFGGLHPFGGAPFVSTTAYWSGWDIARDIVLLPNGRSGYVLDGFGGIHPFGGAPLVSTTAYWGGWDIAKRFTLDPVGGGGYVVDGYGGVHPFGGAAPVATTAYWPGWNIARGITMLPGAPGEGWIVDGYGGLHPFGGVAAIAMSRYTPGRDIVVGVGAA